MSTAKRPNIKHLPPAVQARILVLEAQAAASEFMRTKAETDGKKLRPLAPRH